jgi:6-phosphogluconolactonase
MSTLPEVLVFPSLDELSQAAADLFADRARRAVEQHGSFSVALSGGSTPRELHSLLAGEFRQAVPWNKVRFFWGDERHVGPSDPDSNYRMANETLLSKVPVGAGNVHRVLAEDPDAANAARNYEQTLIRAFDLRPGERPRFDLIFLGMGSDGHTASLFPGTEALREQARLVVANWVDKFKTHRITFTYPVLNNAACVSFLVAGQDKAPALSAVFDEASSRDEYPAKGVCPVDGELVWMIEGQAAEGLPPDVIRQNRS